MERKKSLTINALARVLMYTLNMLVPVLVGPYLARVLDVNLYAEYNAGLSIAQWFLPFAIFGIYTYGMRQASRERDDKAKTDRIFMQLFLFGVISTSIVWLAYMAFVVLAKTDYFWLYALLGIQIVANYFAIEWINEAFENYTFILYKTALVRLAYIVSIFVFVKKPGDILPYAAISSLLVFFNNFFGYCYIKRKVPFVHVSAKELVVLIKPLFLVLLLTNANMLFLMLDRLYLSLFSKVNVYVTYYTMSMLILTAIMNVVSSIIFVTIPRLSNYLFGGSWDEYRNLLNKSAHSFYLIAIPICAGIAALGPEIIYVYGGNHYVGAGSTLIVFGIRFIINAIDLSLSNQVLFVNGMEKRLLRIYLIGGGLNVLFDTGLLLAQALTPVLLISTTAVCDLTVVALQNRTIHRELGKGVSPLDRTTWKYIGVSLCFLAIAAGFRALLKVELVMGGKLLLFVLAVIAVCAAFYCATLYIMKDPYFLLFRDKLRSRLKRLLFQREGK